MKYIAKLIGWFSRIPYWLLALVARVATFEVFWRSGKAKLDDWPGTISLFTDTFKVPVLPPELAAKMSLVLELGGSALVLAGLATRFAALALLGMVAVIQIFVFPEAWPTHVQWVAFLLLLVARGAGLLSLDGLVARWWR